MSATAPGIDAGTSSADETRRLAAALAELARPDDLVLLIGGLGAGKTAFAQGFGQGLGIDDQINSPTFALVQSYCGRLDLHHLDAYRIEAMEETIGLGLSELLDDGAVTLIEWADRIAPALPPDHLEIRLTYGDGEHERRFEVLLRGATWQPRRRAISVALAPWTDGSTSMPTDRGPEC
jgi:tRNA threonylcarbamoyladenosine biosynthesis protein TsaE